MTVTEHATAQQRRPGDSTQTISSPTPLRGTFRHASIRYPILPKGKSNIVRWGPGWSTFNATVREYVHRTLKTDGLRRGDLALAMTGRGYFQLPVLVALIPDPSNTYNSGAVALCVANNNGASLATQIAWVKDEHASGLAPLARAISEIAGVPGICQGHISVQLEDIPAAKAWHRTMSTDCPSERCDLSDRRGVLKSWIAHEPNGPVTTDLLDLLRIKDDEWRLHYSLDQQLAVRDMAVALSRRSHPNRAFEYGSRPVRLTQRGRELTRHLTAPYRPSDVLPIELTADGKDMVAFWNGNAVASVPTASRTPFRQLFRRVRDLGLIQTTGHFTTTTVSIAFEGFQPVKPASVVWAHVFENTRTLAPEGPWATARCEAAGP